MDVIKVRSGFDKLNFVTPIISKLENILRKVQEADTLKGKLKDDCESLRIALLSINISKDFQVEEKLPTITYQYLSKFDIVEKDDCLKGKFNDKQKYDLRRTKITIVDGELELPNFEYNCSKGENAPEELSVDTSEPTETVKESKDDLLDFLEKAEKEMYTTTGFLRKKKVKKSNMLLSTTSKEFNLVQVDDYNEKNDILQVYSNAYYKKEKIEASKEKFIEKIKSKYFEDELNKSYPREDPELIRVYVEMCNIIYNKILKNIGLNIFESDESDKSNKSIIDKYGGYFSENDLCSFFVKITKIRRNILSAIKIFVKGSNSISSYADILFEERKKFNKSKIILDKKLQEMNGVIEERLKEEGDTGELRKKLNDWKDQYKDFKTKAGELLGIVSKTGVLTHYTNFIDLCNVMVEYHKSKKNKEKKVDFFENIKNILFHEGNTKELSHIISSQILKKNNREDVDYGLIINNIFTTYLLNIELSYKKYMYFCKAFYTVSSMNLLSSILKPEELIDVMESLKMKNKINSTKYSDLRRYIQNIDRVKGELEGWLDGHTEGTPPGGDIIKAWNKDLNEFSNMLNDKDNDGEKTLIQHLDKYSVLEKDIEIKSRQIDILKMSLRAGAGDQGDKEKIGQKIKDLEKSVSTNKSSQKGIEKKLKESKIAKRVAFYKELIPHFKLLMADPGENEQEYTEIMRKIRSQKKLMKTQELLKEYEKYNKTQELVGGGKTRDNYRYYKTHYCLLNSTDRNSIQIIKGGFFDRLNDFNDNLTKKTHIEFLSESNSTWINIFEWLCPLFSQNDKLFSDCSKKTGLYDTLYYPITVCGSFKELEKYNTISKNSKEVEREKIKIQKSFNKTRNALNRVWRGSGSLLDIFSIVKFFSKKQLQISPSIYYKITNVVKNFIDKYIRYGRVNVSRFGIIPRINKYIKKINSNRKQRVEDKAEAAAANAEDKEESDSEEESEEEENNSQLQTNHKNPIGVAIRQPTSPGDEENTPTGEINSPLPLPQEITPQVGVNGTLLINISSLETGMWYSLENIGYIGLMFQCPDITNTYILQLILPSEEPRQGVEPISQIITIPGTQSETKAEVVGLRDNIDMLIRGDDPMSITNYIRDLLYNSASYKLEGNNINYLEEFRKFFEDNDNLLYPVKSLLLTQQYEKEIRKIQTLSKELDAFKGLMMMIHNGSNLEEISELKERSNILKGGAGAAGAAGAADKPPIIVPAGKPVPNVGQEGSVLNEAQQKEKEEKQEIFKKIEDCQKDLFKLLQEYQNTIKRLEESHAYKVGKFGYEAGSGIFEDIRKRSRKAAANTVKRLEDSNKKDGFEGFQDRMRYNLTSPTSIERYVRERMGLDQNGIKITLDVFSELGVKDIKDIIKNDVTRDDILQNYKIHFSNPDNVITGNLYDNLKDMDANFKNITKKVRENEELSIKNPSAPSFPKNLEALIPQQEKIKEEIEAEKINVDKQIEDYVENEYGSKIDGIIRTSNEEVEKEKKKEEERERKRAEEDEKARQRDEEKKEKDKRDKLLGKKGFFDSFKRDSLNVKLADAKERIEKAREAGLSASDIARIQEEIDSLEKQIADEKKQEEEREAEALKAKEKERKAKEDAENAASLTAAAKAVSENAKTPEEKQIADDQLEKAKEAEAIAKVEQVKAEEAAAAAVAAAAAARPSEVRPAAAPAVRPAVAAQGDDLPEPIEETPATGVTPKSSGILKQTTDGFKPGRVGLTDTNTGDDNDVVEYKRLKEEYNVLVKKYKQYEGGYNNILKYNYRNNNSSMINSFYSKIKNYINNYIYLRDKYIHILEKFNVYKDNGSYMGNSIFSSLNKEIKDCEKYIKSCDDIINKLETLKSDISEKYYSKKTKKEEQNDYIKNRIEEIEKMSNFKNFDNKNEVREMEFLCSTINSYRYNRLDFMNEPEWNKRLFKGKGICSDFKKKYEEHNRKKKEQERKKKEDDKKQKDQTAKVKELENKLTKLQKQPVQQPQRQQIQQIQQPQRQQIQQPQRQDQPQRQQMQQQQPAPGQQRPSQAAPGQQRPSQAAPGQQRPSQAAPEQSEPGVQIPEKAKGLSGSDKALVPFNADTTGKKPMELNMGKTVDQKLLEIGKKQGSSLVVPPKEKLTKLSNVVNNDKFLDIIRNKKFSEFTNKEIKDVDLVRDRFNSFVNDYYGLLDMFYTYKKNKEKGEKEDIIVLLKQEKQIEELKDIVLEYKTNLEKFKNACEIKVEEVEANSGKEIKDKEKEFKDVFQYMQGLFKEELKEEKNATKKNTKILKEENDLQKEKIILLEDKKKSKKTPKKQRKAKSGKKDRTGKKDRKGKSGKKDRTGKKDRKGKKDRTGKKDRKK